MLSLEYPSALPADAMVEVMMFVSVVPRSRLLSIGLWAARHNGNAGWRASLVKLGSLALGKARRKRVGGSKLGVCCGGLAVPQEPKRRAVRRPGERMMIRWLVRVGFIGRPECDTPALIRERGLR